MCVSQVVEVQRLTFEAGNAPLITYSFPPCVLLSLAPGSRRLGWRCALCRCTAAATFSAAFLSQGVRWVSNVSWVDNSIEANEYHSASDEFWSAPPYRMVDRDVTTAAGFIGTSGFAVLDFGAVFAVTGFRIRGDGSPSDVRDLTLNVAKSLAGPWTRVASMVAPRAVGDSWKEAPAFLTRSRLLMLRWASNYGYPYGTRVVDVEVQFQGDSVGVSCPARRKHAPRTALLAVGSQAPRGRTVAVNESKVRCESSTVEHNTHHSAPTQCI